MLASATHTVTVTQTAAPEAAERAVARRRSREQTPAPKPKPVPKATVSTTPAKTRPSPDSAIKASATASAGNALAEAPVGNTPSEYRLIYDEEFSRTFIQIVDRSSGEEILRFPPEELLKFIDNSIGRNKNNGTAGLFLDRNV
jgi:uncharacterized FlaG/YvyC family protein